MIRYLTGVDRLAASVASRWAIGLLVTPDTKQYAKRVTLYPFWAMDNSCFAHPEKFDTDKHIAWLRALNPKECLFASAPDVLGNAQRTLERSAPVLPRIREVGYPAALVAQDGLENLVVPWDTFDVLFIGGSTAWKLSWRAWDLVAQAKARGKRVHMGRVNSFKRLLLAQEVGCDSADGTFLRFARTSTLLDWHKKLNAYNSTPNLGLV